MIEATIYRQALPAQCFECGGTQWTQLGHECLAPQLQRSYTMHACAGCGCLERVLVPRKGDA